MRGSWAFNENPAIEAEPSPISLAWAHNITSCRPLEGSIPSLRQSQSGHWDLESDIQGGRKEHADETQLEASQNLPHSSA